MLEPVEKEIDGIGFKYQPMMATKARKILIELIHKFGGSLAAGVERLGDAELDADLSQIIGKLTSPVGGIIRELTSNLTPEYYENLCKEFAERSFVTNPKGDWIAMKKEVRDMYFGVKLLTEAKWLMFCLEAQYADFFGLVRTASESAAAYQRVAQSQSNSQPDLTGRGG